MLKFLLLIFIFFYVLYKISTVYMKIFIKKSANKFEQNNKSNSKGILDKEGDFIDYEEVD